GARRRRRVLGGRRARAEPRQGGPGLRPRLERSDAEGSPALRGGDDPREPRRADSGAGASAGREGAMARAPAAAHPERAPGARQQVHHAARPALRAEADYRAAAGQRGADDHAARRARRQSGGARGVPGERLLGDVGAAEGGRRELDARAAGGEDAVVSLRQYVWRELSEERRAEILRRPALADDARVAERVAAIIAQVRRGGDAALAELCESLDGVRLTSFEVAPAEHDAAADALTAEQRAAIETAARNI